MHSMCIRNLMFVFELFIITDETTFIPDVPKKYTSLKSKIFAVRSDQSVKLVSFVRQVLNLEFDI